MPRYVSHYLTSQHGCLGVGKRPDELTKPDRSAELLTPVEAARVAGLSPDHIRVLARRGTLPAQIKGGRFYIRRGDAEQLRGEP